MTIQKKKVLVFFSFGVLFLLSALRSSEVGNDTHNYVDIFNHIEDFDSEDYDGHFEIGYMFLNYLSKNIAESQQTILIVTSIIIFGGYARFILKYSNMVWLSIFLFFTNGFFTFALSGIRQSIAIVILLFSYDFLRSNRFLKFTALVLFASLFHSSAVLFLISYFVTRLRWNLITALSFLFITLFLYFGFDSLLSVVFGLFTVYQYYDGGIYFGDTRLASILNLLIGCSILLCCILLRSYKEENYIRVNNNDICVRDNEKMLLLVCTSVAIIFVSLKLNLLDRAAMYFNAFSIVLLPNSIKMLQGKKIYLFVIPLIVGAFFCYASIIQIMRPEWNRIYPYTFYFNM